MEGWQKKIIETLKGLIMNCTEELTKEIDGFVARMRESKQAWKDEQSEQGRAAGREWAEHKASYDLLKILAENRYSIVDAVEDECDRDDGSFYGCAMALALLKAMHIKDPEDVVITDAIELRPTILGGPADIHSLEYVVGFVEAAAELWDTLPIDLR